MSEKSSFRRLGRLAITVVLNIILLVAVTGWAVGQNRYAYVVLKVPSVVGSISLDQSGLHAIAKKEATPVFKVLFWKTATQGPDPWDVRSQWEGSVTDHGGLHIGHHNEQTILGVRHWFIITGLFFLSAIHHRRFISKLIFRRGKHV